MIPYSYFRQLRTVIIIELVIFISMAAVATSFWDSYCSSNSFLNCLKTQSFSFFSFLFLSFIRPFVFTPASSFALMAGNSFGPLLGALLSTLSAVLSTIPVFILGKILGKRLINPWLKSNLPQTFLFIHSQDWKVILASRLIFLLPFDVLSFSFGALDFRFSRIIFMTILGILPEMYVFASFGSPQVTLLGSTMVTLVVVCGFFLLPGLIIEYVSRKNGSSLWIRLKAMWKEIKYEIKLNNQIVKRHQHDPKKIPILLIYGFFSSRRSLTALERILSNLGYEVISFNLGGVLGTFFTKSIVETANFIDFKIKRQMERHNFQKIHIVAHSKGGFVALWWLLKLGGSQYCKKLVTMGTPFRGTKLTWLALMTPLGFIFRDMWQMRPGSDFLKAIQRLEVPEGVSIYNFYSLSDAVSGEGGILDLDKLTKNIIAVPMHHISHFEFLYRKEVGTVLARMLGSPYITEEKT